MKKGEFLREVWKLGLDIYQDPKELDVIMEVDGVGGKRIYVYWENKRIGSIGIMEQKGGKITSAIDVAPFETIFEKDGTLYLFCGGFRDGGVPITLFREYVLRFFKERKRRYLSLAEGFSEIFEGLKECEG